MTERAFFLAAEDGARISVRHWLIEKPPRAIVQIAHGLAEHCARYGRLAGALNAAGYDVYASDLRGHGPGCEPADLGHLGDSDGWAKTAADLWTLNRRIAADALGVPIVLLGHSMGSFLARQFAFEHSDALAGLVLSGSNGKPPAMATVGRLLARVERTRLGPRGKSGLLNQMMFGDFNKPFRPARTTLDWLSRDEAEVDAYLADPLCGFPFTTQLAIDLLDGLAFVSSPKSLAPIRKDLPIYVLSGEKDPVGANIKGLIADLKAAGFVRLTSRLYPEGRHEMFNETNRDEVTRDLVKWLDQSVRR
jgi:alpha-beta hydrolase superfamily lysophospholipase